MIASFPILDVALSIRPDEKSIMTYVSCFYHAFQNQPKVHFPPQESVSYHYPPVPALGPSPPTYSPVITSGPPLKNGTTVYWNPRDVGHFHLDICGLTFFFFNIRWLVRFTYIWKFSK